MMMLMMMMIMDDEVNSSRLLLRHGHGPGFRNCSPASPETPSRSRWPPGRIWPRALEIFSSGLSLKVARTLDKAPQFVLNVGELYDTTYSLLQYY